MFLFRFENDEDRRNIIQESPWSVMNNMLVLVPLTDGIVVSELSFNTSSFWIQIHGLPVEKLNRTNAEIIVKRLGKLLALEANPEGDCLTRGFLRVRVEINLEQPLSKGFWLKGKSESGQDRWISFRFEKLPDFCYACGRLGHDNRACRFVSRNDGRKSAIPIEIIRAEVDAAEMRVQALIRQRPVIQMDEHGARVINDNREEVVAIQRTEDNHEHVGGGGHHAVIRTNTAVLQGTDVQSLKDDRFFSYPLLE